MKTTRKASLTLSALLLTLAGNTLAQVQSVPPLMNFQGRLAKPDGTALADGTYSVTFSLWSALSGGTQVWTETDSVTARNGAFAVLLGKTTALTDSLFSAPVYLQIQIGGAAALAPRQQLITVAHAFKADTVPDGSLTAAKFQGGTLTPGGAAGGDLTGTYPNPLLAMLTTSLNKVSGGKMTALPNGNIGIGTTTPDALLNVAGNIHESGADFSLTGRGGGAGNHGGAGRALVDAGLNDPSLPGRKGLIVNIFNDFGSVQIDSDTYINGKLGVGTTSPAVALDIVGEAQATGAGGNYGYLGGPDYGVFGSSANEYAVRGEISGAADANGWAGVSGKDNTSGNYGQLGTKTYGVAGRSVASSGVGVYGETTNTNGVAGVQGIYTSNGNYGYLGAAGAGVFGSSPVGSTPGVAGYNTAGGNGVYGSGGGYGVFAAGNLGYTGSLLHNSDARYKTNVAPLDNALDAILNLRGVSYEWKRKEFPQMNFGAGRQNGFIAQEMETVLPALVKKDKEGFRSVDYIQVIPVLVEGIKAQQKQIEELKAQLKQRGDQQKDIAELKTQIAALIAATPKAQKTDGPQR